MIGSKPAYCYIYLVDEFHTLTDAINDRFKNSIKYTFNNYSGVDLLFNELKQISVAQNRSRVTVYVVNHVSGREVLNKIILDFTKKMQIIDPGMNILFVVENKIFNTQPPWTDKTGYAVIPKNENVVLRITNYIMGIISKEGLETKYRKARKMAWILGLFLAGSVLLTLFFYLFYPQYF